MLSLKAGVAGYGAVLDALSLGHPVLCPPAHPV